MSEAAAALAAEMGKEWNGWGGGKARGHTILGLFGALSNPRPHSLEAEAVGTID